MQRRWIVVGSAAAGLLVGLAGAAAWWFLTALAAPRGGGLSFVASAVDPSTSHVFLIDRTYGLLVLDSRTGRLLQAGRWPPGQGDGALLIDGPAHRAYVAVSTGAYTGIRTGPTMLHVLDTRTLQVLQSSQLGVGPTDLGLDPHTARLIATNQGDDTATLVDAHSGAVLRTVPVVSWPTGVSVDAPLGVAFILGSVPDHQTHALSVLDLHTGRVRHTWHHIGVPTGSLIAVVVDVATQHLFVANNGSVLDATNPTPRPSVEMLDARSGRQLRTIKANPRAMQLDARLARLVITDEPDTVHVVDVRSGTSVLTISLPDYQGTSSVEDLVLDPRTQHAFVSGYVPGITTLDARTGRIIRLQQGSNGTTQLVVNVHAGRVVAAGDYGIAIIGSRTGAVVQTLTPTDIAHFTAQH